MPAEVPPKPLGKRKHKVNILPTWSLGLSTDLKADVVPVWAIIRQYLDVQAEYLRDSTLTFVSIHTTRKEPRQMPLLGAIPYYFTGT